MAVTDVTTYSFLASKHFHDAGATTNMTMQYVKYNNK